MPQVAAPKAGRLFKLLKSHQGRTPFGYGRYAVLGASAIQTGPLKFIVYSYIQ